MKWDNLNVSPDKQFLPVLQAYYLALWKTWELKTLQLGQSTLATN